ncbi:MAG: hypothetical protein E7058_04680 [Lentisphaerae bacterium]|nr:hypothetical protein [Lentisphaerota bacterium]
MPFGSDVIKKIFTFTLLGRIVPVFGSLAFAVYIGFIAWQSVGPEKPEPDRARKTIATAAVNKAVEEIRASRGDIRSAVMVHFANDPSDFVSDAMRNKLNASGVLFLEDITFSERIDKLLNLRTEGVSSTRDALAAAKGCNVDGILWGKIDSFESFDKGAVFTGEWTLIDKKGNEICHGTFNEDTTVKKVETAKADGKDKDAPAAIDLDPIKKELENAAAPVRQTASQIPWYLRFLGFVLLVLILPVVTISFLRWMVSKKSNGINAFVLALYTIIGAICAFFMIGGEFTSIWTTLLFMGAVVFSFCYNVALMSFALKLES